MHRPKILASLLALALLTAGAGFRPGRTGRHFTRYVAFGDSLTAGFSSSALARTYQLNSYPFLIYQAATGQATGFDQPLISDPGISGLSVCNGANPPSPCGILRLVSLGVSPTIAPTPGRGTPTNLTLPRAYNNIAVPGATVHDLVATRNGGFHDVILRNTNPAQGATQLQQGLSRQPTFVSLWIGNNDALGAATSGIVIDGVTLTPRGPVRGRLPRRRQRHRRLGRQDGDRQHPGRHEHPVRDHGPALRASTRRPASR